MKLLFCAYCGLHFESEDPRERFCSKRCTKLYAAKHQISTNEEPFILSIELTKLQTKVGAMPLPNESVSRKELMQFYDDIFNQIRQILKWLNANAIKAEYEQTQEKQNLLNQKIQSDKLDKLLNKAAELKRENKELKQFIRKHINGNVDLAQTLLGVNQNCSSDDLKNKYRLMAKVTHPDTDAGNEHIFKAVKSAYEILMVYKESDKT